MEEFIKNAIEWFNDTFYDNSHHSGRGDFGEIVTHDFDSMEEMIASFKKFMQNKEEKKVWHISDEYMEGLKTGATLMKGEFPHWRKATERLDSDVTGECYFKLDKDGKTSPYYEGIIEPGEIYITLSDIESLPKED